MGRTRNAVNGLNCFGSSNLPLSAQSSINMLVGDFFMPFSLAGTYNKFIDACYIHGKQQNLYSGSLYFSFDLKKLIVLRTTLPQSHRMQRYLVSNLAFSKQHFRVIQALVEQMDKFFFLFVKLKESLKELSYILLCN